MNKDELVKILTSAKENYYNNLKNPTTAVMPDEEFDLLEAQLRKIDPTNPILSSVGIRPMGITFKHNIPAGSQEKLSDKSSYDKWIATTKNFGATSWVKGWKLDGLTVVIDYEYVNGELQRGLTRGDGFEGEDITANVVQMMNVKKRLPIPFTGSLRGEMILAKSLFEEHFRPLEYTNPRNAASGVSRDQKGKGLCKYLKVIYFDMIGNDGCTTEIERLNYMKNKMGLEVVETDEFTDAEEMWNSWLEMASKRDSLDYEIDGVVVRVNDLAIQEQMGATSDLRPKSQRCIKFEAQGDITTLTSVEVTIGSTGAHIPTAKFNPIQIGGVTVSSAQIGNYNEVERLQIAVGDTIYVTRRGDVIPKIEHVTYRPENRQPIVAPDKCIICGCPTEMVGAYLVCTSDTCEGVQFRKLVNYIVKRNIKHLGDTTIEKLYTDHNIKTPVDIYSLTEDFLATVEVGNGIVGARAKRIMAEIDKSRTAELKDFMGSLSIPFLGRRQAENMIELGIDTLGKFLDLKIDELAALQGFKETRATGIVNGIKNSLNLINDMAKVVTIKAYVPKQVITPASGIQYNICLTGTMTRPRKDIAADIIAKGHLVADKVSKGVTHLCQADPSSVSDKTKKANKLGIKIISEMELNGLI